MNLLILITGILTLLLGINASLKKTKPKYTLIFASLFWIIYGLMRLWGS